jgi:hypothetical protein
VRLKLGISRQTTLVVLLSILLINLFFWHLAATVGLHSAVGGIYYIYFLPAILIGGILRFLLRRPNETGTLVESCVIQYLLLSALHSECSPYGKHSFHGRQDQSIVIG